MPEINQQILIPPFWKSQRSTTGSDQEDRDGKASVQSPESWYTQQESHRFSSFTPRSQVSVKGFVLMTPEPQAAHDHEAWLAFAKPLVHTSQACWLFPRDKALLKAGSLNEPIISLKNLSRHRSTTNSFVIAFVLTF